MTQNTADRLYLLLVDRLRVIGGTRHAAEDIAAEINALTAERDEAAKYRDQYVRECGELTAERDEAREQHKHCGLFLDSANAELRECQSALRLALAGTEQKYFAIPARIDDVRAALADAQARLAEARAEVERLRPAAEAWIAYDDYMMCPEEHEAEKFPVWVAAHKAAKSAQVARAAKERKP